MKNCKDIIYNGSYSQSKYLIKFKFIQYYIKCIWKQKLMSYKKTLIHKAYISSSQQQQQAQGHKLKKIIDQSLFNTSKHNSQYTDYSHLDQMNPQDIGQSESQHDNQLRILDQQSGSHDSSSKLSNQQFHQDSQDHKTPSESTQLNPIQKKRIQILKKLQQQEICSPQEYESIINKLQQQNQKLQSDLEVLRQKVDLLKLKQMRKHKEKNKIEGQKKRYPEQEYRMMKKELKAKYKELQRLQKKSSKSKTSFVMEIQYREFVNKLIELQTTCQSLSSSLKDERIIAKNLNNQLRKYTGTKLAPSPEVQQLQVYNKQLKNKIFLMKKVLSSQQQSELEIHNFNILMRQKQKRVTDAVQLYEANQRGQERRQLMRRTRLATVGAGEFEMLETKFGIVKLYTIDSKVRARTDFSFQDQGMEGNTKQSALMGRNHSAFKQVAYDTSKSNRVPKIHPSSLKNLLPVMQFTPLKSSQINQLAVSLRHQTKNLQHMSLNMQTRLKCLQQQLNPHLKRQGSRYTFSKEKDMFLAKNKLLILQLQKIYQQKIELLREYNIVERYYGDGERMDKHNITRMTDRNLDQKNNPTFPRISQVSQFNRSKSEMKFKKINGQHQTMIQRRSILSAGKSLNKIQKFQQRQAGERKAENSPSVPTYNNGRSQPVEMKLIEGQQQSLKSYHQQENAMRMVEVQQNGAQVDLNFSCFKLRGEGTASSSRPWKQDFVGEVQLENCHFDDRIYAGMGPKMYIDELTVHHNNQNVLLIQARYKPDPRSSLADTLLVTELSYKLSSSTLLSTINASEVISTTTELSVNDYIKQVKLLFNTDLGLIVRLQVVSKFNVKYDFGNKKLPFPTALSPHLNINIEVGKDSKKWSKSKNHEESKNCNDQSKGSQCNKFYAFDIKADEYPGFMFGNYRLNESGQIMLSALGFAIHKQEK